MYAPQIRSVLENDENDFIKQVCFETDSELKNNSIFFKGQDAFVTQGYSLQ